VCGQKSDFLSFYPHLALYHILPPRTVLPRVLADSDSSRNARKSHPNLQEITDIVYHHRAIRVRYLLADFIRTDRSLIGAGHFRGVVGGPAQPPPPRSCPGPFWQVCFRRCSRDMPASRHSTSCLRPFLQLNYMQRRRFREGMGRRTY
jgi:hypothetical protein